MFGQDTTPLCHQWSSDGTNSVKAADILSSLLNKEKKVFHKSESVDTILSTIDKYKSLMSHDEKIPSDDEDDMLEGMIHNTKLFLRRAV